jgi:cytochrome c biogenesis protein CcmG, thiol:disulfide interchange protein DsbE
MNLVKGERTLHIMLLASVVALAFVLADTMRDKTIRVGDMAPDFSVRTENGLTVGRSAHGGKLLVLNFWATWCPPCIEETPSLNAFTRAYRDKGVVVLGISVDKNEAKYKNFIKRFNVAFLTSRDPEGKISGEYGTYIYPESYIIDREGRVVQKIIGKTDWTDPNLTAFIDGLLR